MLWLLLSVLGVEGGFWFKVGWAALKILCVRKFWSGQGVQGGGAGFVSAGAANTTPAGLSSQ